MFHKQFVAALCLTFLVLYPCSGVLAQSSHVYAKDRPSFAAASSNFSTVDFESIAPAKGVARYPSDKDLTIGRINLRTSGGGRFGTGTLYVLSASYAIENSLYNIGTGAKLVWMPPTQSGNAYLEITLPKGVTAVSADVWAGQPDISTIDVIATTSDGQAHSSAVTTEKRPDSAFVSFVSDEEITSLRFQLPQGQTYLILDNLTFGKTKKVAVESSDPAAVSPTADTAKRQMAPLAEHLVVKMVGIWREIGNRTHK